MKPCTVRKIKMVWFAFAAILLIGISNASRVQAQGPCPIFQTGGYGPIFASQQVVNLQNQGASVTCDSTHVYVTMPTGLFFMISVPDNGPVSMFSFDPVTGQTTTWYILGGDGNNPPTLIIQNSVYGFINMTDGWYSIFYPIGNPFSAAIQDPMQALMMGFALPSVDPWGIDPNPSPRPQPIQDCCQ